jgi:hypothetical protein
MRSDDRSPHARYGHVVPKRVVKRLRLFLQLPLQLGRLGPSRSLPPLPPTLQRGPRLRKCRVSGGGGDFRLLQGKLAGSLLHRTLPQLALCLLLCTLCLLQSRLRPFQLEECVGHRRRRLLGLLPLLLLLLLLLPLRERHRVANACWCFCHCSCWLGLQLGRWLKCWPCCWLSCLPGELWGGLHFRGRLLAVGRPNAAAAAAGGGGRRKTAARCCRRPWVLLGSSAHSSRAPFTALVVKNASRAKPATRISYTWQLAPPWPFMQDCARGGGNGTVCAWWCGRQRVGGGGVHVLHT